MTQAFNLHISSTKWWELVWFLPTTVQSPPDSTWLRLEDHACGGFSCDTLNGWVKPLPTSGLQGPQEAIVEEAWCSRQTGLDYEVTEQDRAEYAAHLASLGLDAGDLTMLCQAVYPLARTQAVCDLFGIEPSAESAAALLLLGQNCD